MTELKGSSEIAFFANRPIRLIGYDESAIPMPHRFIGWPQLPETSLPEVAK
jgi:hypothetical protein